MSLRSLISNIVTPIKRAVGIGITDINPKDKVDVDGIGTTHSGTYYVDEVSHKITSENQRQQFDLKRNATGNEPESDDK